MIEPLTLSIVIPVYNEEHYLKACLDAIAAQTTAPDEVIVVDNNSTDSSRTIAQSYPFVRVVAEGKQGIVYARDTGFAAVNSAIIGRIDADTILPPGWVEKVKRFYHDERNAQSALTGGAYFYNLRWPLTVGLTQHIVAFSVNRLVMGHHMIWGTNMAIPKKLWQAVEPLTCHRQDIHEDIDLAIHLYRAHYKIAYRPSLRVGAEMRRVHSNRKALWPNLMLWPRTLRVHGYKMWLFAWLSTVTLYCLVPLALVAERLAGFLGRPRKGESTG